MTTSMATSFFSKSIFEKYEPRPSSRRISTFYENWSRTYDWDMLDMGYRLHDVASNLLMENVDNSHESDCFVIDVGCGTGFVGKAMRKKGFKGILYGVDESQSMIDVANKKGVYDDLYLQYLCAKDKIDINENLLFDGLTCVAAFGTQHIHPNMLPIFVKHVKADGILVFSAQNHPRDESDKEILEDEIEKLVEAGSIRKISLTKEFYFNRGRDSRSSVNAASCQLYCYAKLSPDIQMTKL